MIEGLLYGGIGFAVGVLISIAFLYGKAGHLLAVGLKGAQDRIDRELVVKEAELRRLHDQLLEAIEAMTEGFALFDGRDRLVLCNSVFRDMYKTHAEAIRPGATMEEILRAGLKAGCFPTALGWEDGWLAEQMEQHFHPRGQVEQRLADGRHLIIQERRTKDGGIVGVRTDVTNLKVKEHQMIQSTKLATLGEMAAGMSHELSQPLNIIRFAAEGALLKIDSAKASPEYQREQFDRIRAQAARMAEIMEHMRVFSRQDHHDLIAFDPNVALAAAIQLAEPQLKGLHIALKAEFEDHGGRVTGRPIQLEQVILNLINNARDAIVEWREKGGRDTEGLIRLSCRGGADGRSVVITVADNGGGIPDDVRERVFEPFFTTKDVGRGTGLGLSVSYGIIGSMGGAMTVANHEDGACFTVTLPCATAFHEAADAVSEVAARPEGGNTSPLDAATCHVLIVDDESDAVDLMSDFLEEEGCRVSRAYGGREALDRALADPPDVLVTDLRMPNMDGRALISALREHHPTLPVIVVTGHVGQTEQPFEADERIIVLKKPIGLFALEDAVRTMRGKIS